MSDKDFFDASGQVPPDRVDDFVTHLRAESVKRGGHIPLSLGAVNALARKRALANGNKSVGVGPVESAPAQDVVAGDGERKS